jgi:hypothetical protein
MGYRLTPVIKQIMSVLNKHNLEIVKMEGDHIKINRPKQLPQLKRPIILVNVKKLSNKVRINLLDEAEETGINRAEFDNINF